MRRGELLSLEWQNVHLDRRTATLPMTKNGSTRVVPLTENAVAVLQNLPVKGGTGFPSEAGRGSSSLGKNDSQGIDKCFPVS